MLSAEWSVEQADESWMSWPGGGGGGGKILLLTTTSLTRARSQYIRLDHLTVLQPPAKHRPAIIQHQHNILLRIQMDMDG